ncbi:MAG: hypothetical protein N2663_03220 [Chlorobi bacterium]|nr:hypothetical protein [Chlorobiota bacterium]
MKQSKHIGTILRPHGLDGSVVVELNSADAVVNGMEVLIGLSPSYAVAYTIESVNLNNERAILRLAQITTRADAERLREHGIFTVSEQAVQGTSLVPHPIIGWKAVDYNGTLLGEIAGFENAPTYPMLRVVTSGGGVLLIPFVDAFIVGTNDAARTLTIQLPDGFIEAQLPGSKLATRKRKR